MTIQEMMGNNYGKFFDNTDRQQDPNLPPGYRENDIADTDEEMQKILDECEEEDEKLPEEIIN